MKIKKKTAALLFACAWAVFALTAPLAFRTTSARAEDIDDVITMRVVTNANYDGIEQYSTIPFGTFYRGIKLLKSAKWETSSGSSGTIDISDEFNNGDGPAVNIGEYDKDSPLILSMNSPNPICRGGHDFTSGGGSWGATENKNNHYAVCANCGFKLEVAHRPEDNRCKDCTISELNYYSFTLPDSYTPIEWDPSSGATFDISFTAQICWGFVLTLKLSCSGALSAGGDASIPYSISSVDSGGTGTATTPSNASLTEEPIWYLRASEVLIGDEMRTDLSGTITVTLSGANDTDIPAYAGTFTDTLTFSVTLEQETV